MKLIKLALALIAILIALPAMAERSDDDRDGAEARHKAHNDRDDDEGKHRGEE